MEGGPNERYTDNNPLDRGKISAKEGGTRVPLIITGPGIAPGVQSNVMVNGLRLLSNDIVTDWNHEARQQNPRRL